MTTTLGFPIKYITILETKNYQRTEHYLALEQIAENTGITTDFDKYAQVWIPFVYAWLRDETIYALLYEVKHRYSSFNEV